MYGGFYFDDNVSNLTDALFGIKDKDTMLKICGQEIQKLRQNTAYFPGALTYGIWMQQHAAECPGWIHHGTVFDFQLKAFLRNAQEIQKNYQKTGECIRDDFEDYQMRDENQDRTMMNLLHGAFFG